MAAALLAVVEALVSELTTPREARTGILYVLQNWLKHVRGACGIDGRSSGPWFDGWSSPPPPPPNPSPVARPRTWLAAVGWWLKGGGTLEADEAPATALVPGTASRQPR